jgi:hypothetical protein
MICFSKDWFPKKKPPLIRLRMPKKVTIIRNCDEERIDAVENEKGHLVEMVVYTKTRCLMRMRNVERWF